MSFDSNSIPAKLIQLALGATPAPDFFAPYTYSEVEPLARHHRLLSLAAQCFPENPQAIADQRQIALRDLQIKALTSSLKSQLTQAGIPHWEFKGAALGERLGEKVSRESRDIDLLVKLTNFQQAFSLLSNGRQILSRPNPKNWLSPKKDAQLLNLNPSVRIELHWSNLPSYYPQRHDERIWNFVEQQSEIPAELEFDLLATHGVLHGYFRLRWLRDIHLLIAKFPDLRKSPNLTIAQQLSLELLPLLENNDASPPSQLVLQWAEHIHSGKMSTLSKVVHQKTRWRLCNTWKSKTQMTASSVVGWLFQHNKHA